MKLNPSRPTPIGVYLTDTSEIYNAGNVRAYIDDRYKGYLPVVNALQFNATAEISFSDTKNKDREIVSYNRAVSNKNLDSETLRTKRIDITHNDLYLGPIRLLLNFTSYPVTVNLPGEYRKVYARIEQDRFIDHAGKIMIFTIHTLNTPTFIHAMNANGNYLESLVNQLDNRPGESLVHMKEIYQYAESKWPLFKQLPNGCIANTIKVISLQEIDERDILNLKSKQFYVPNLDLSLGFVDILDIEENPSTHAAATGGRELQAIVKTNSLVCYIVDNDDYLSDRYVNIAGAVKKINKVKDNTLPNGLYMIQTGSDNKVNREIVCTLKEIDNNPYVFKSIEEATQGANLRQQYKDEVELAKAQLENARVESASESLRIKNEYELQLAALRGEAERNRMVMEAELHAMRVESERLKATTVDKKNEHEISRFDLDQRREFLKLENELERYRMDRVSSRSKYYHEERKYERDSTLETLKAVGAAAGLLATGFLVYKKFAEGK